MPGVLSYEEHVNVCVFINMCQYDVSDDVSVYVCRCVYEYNDI